MTTAPTIVRASDPEEFTRDDGKRGRAVYRTRIDASAGPTSGVVTGTARLDAGDVEASPSHNLPETAHVLSGGGTAIFEDRDVRLDPGDTVFVPAHVHHSWRAGEEGLELLYVFPADRFHDVEYHWVPA